MESHSPTSLDMPRSQLSQFHNPGPPMFGCYQDKFKAILDALARHHHDMHGSMKWPSVLGSFGLTIPLLMAAMILPHHGKLSHQLVVWSPQHVALGQSHRRAWNGRHANANVLLPYFFNTAVIDLPECGGRATYLDCSQRLSFRGFGHCIDTFVSTLTK